MSHFASNELVRHLLDLFTPSPLSSPHRPREVITSGPLRSGRQPKNESLTCRSTASAGQAATVPAELPRDALEQILMRCDTDTLLGSVPAVCKAWREAASAPSLWRHRVAPKLLAEVDALAALGPRVSAARLFLATQGRNLLRNPGFRRDANSQPPLGRTAPRSKWQRNAWVTTTTLGDGVAWELPPAGIRPYDTSEPGALPPPLPYPGSGRPLAARVQQQLTSLFGTGSGGLGNGGGGASLDRQLGCLATTNDWCEIVQVVDLDWELQRRGLTAAQAAHLLDSELSLRLSVHVGSRWDCVGQYSVGLLLDEGNGNANGYGGGGTGSGGGAGGGGGPLADADSIPSLQSFVMRPTRHHFFVGRCRCTCDSWQRFQYLLPACPRGVRRAVVVLRGRRAPNSLIVSPMPRYCGAKFASAELVFT